MNEDTKDTRVERFLPGIQTQSVISFGPQAMAKKPLVNLATQVDEPSRLFVTYLQKFRLQVMLG